MDILMIKNK